MQHRKLARLIGCVFLLGHTLISAAQDSNDPKSAFGSPLSCTGASETRFLSPRNLSPVTNDGRAAVAWVRAAAGRIGYGSPPPTSGQALAAAAMVAQHVRAGNLVAAQMANEEAKKLGLYPGAWFESVEAVLIAMTQPVLHASYPTSVRAEGESRPAGSGQGTHGVDLEQSSGALSEIIARAAVAKRALAKEYSKPAVRYYLLAHAFRDQAGLDVARAQVCALKLPEERIRSLDVSAKYMAMPFKAEVSAAAAAGASK